MGVVAPGQRENYLILVSDDDPLWIATFKNAKCDTVIQTPMEEDTAVFG